MTNQSWKALPPHPDDCILLVKQYMHHNHFSQAPLLIMPKSLADSVNWDKLEISPLVPLGATVIKEFRKSAERFGAPPWNFLKAQAYLQKLCDNNEAQCQPPDPAPLQFIKTNRSMAKSVRPAEMFVSGLDVILAGRSQPREVRVAPLTEAQKRRRLSKLEPNAMSFSDVVHRIERPQHI